jgi:hypothetical protein
MIAFDASAVGNMIVKSPAVDVLSEPKSSAATAVSSVLLYINAPRAVIVAADQVVSAKSINAVVPDEVGTCDTVSVLPPVE